VQTASDGVADAIGSAINGRYNVCILLLKNEFAARDQHEADVAALVGAAAGAVDIGQANAHAANAVIEAAKSEVETPLEVNSKRLGRRQILAANLDVHAGLRGHCRLFKKHDAHEGTYENGR
jgi:hypothetical protein